MQERVYTAGVVPVVARMLLRAARAPGSYDWQAIVGSKDHIATNIAHTPSVLVEYAAVLLARLARLGAAAQQNIASTGGLLALVSLLQGPCCEVSRVAAPVLEALAALCSAHPGCQVRISSIRHLP